MKANKGITIVKETQMKAYCKEFNLDFVLTTRDLLCRGVMVKYSSRRKGYPYRSNVK